MTPDGDERDHVSTGDLPAGAEVARLVAEGHAQCRDAGEGRLSTMYPAPSRVDSELFGSCVVGVEGTSHEAGDSRAPFPIMSVAKPFVLALVGETVGLDAVRRLVGVNATGLPFNSIAAIEREPAGRTNPMVNAGAIATTSLVPGRSPGARWR